MIARQFDSQQWRLPSRCPGAHRHWEQIKPRFIYPDDGCSLLFGFFFMSGQRSFDHFLIASLTGSLHWLLSAPVRFPHQSPHMIAMRANPKGTLDHFSHSARGPHLSPRIHTPLRRWLTAQESAPSGPPLTANLLLWADARFRASSPPSRPRQDPVAHRSARLLPMLWQCLFVANPPLSVSTLVSVVLLANRLLPGAPMPLIVSYLTSFCRDQ